MSPVPKLSWIERTIGPQWPIHLCFLLVGGAVATASMLLHYDSKPAVIVNKAMDASRIHKALMLHANDHGGQFPTASRHANEAYRQLIPDYLPDEREFYVFGSAWHDAAGLESQKSFRQKD